MRSGSTLLKALIATAPDVAHLPEVNFQKVLHSAKHRQELESSHAEPILLLKRPAWFQESQSYPRIPADFPVHRIILIRDVYETVRSVGRMMIGKTFDRIPGLWGQKLIATRYWAPITRNLLAHGQEHPIDSVTLTYESLLESPEERTLSIFQFLGSEQSTGIRSYSSPSDFKWKWGSDDGSPRIKSKEVQPPRKLGAKDQLRKDKICAIPRINEIRRAAGYSD